MLEIQATGAFKKDLKRALKRGKDPDRLQFLLGLLSMGVALPKQYENHRLSGNWSNYWECHIDPDWILIYKIKSDTIILARTGSHNDLFQ